MGHSEPEMIRCKEDIYDRIAAKGFEWLTGSRREDIPPYEGHMTFVWENANYRA